MVEKELREQDLARHDARAKIEQVAKEAALVRSRATKNAAQQDEETVARSLVWLARAVAGETAAEIARTAVAATEGNPLPDTIRIANKKTAELLGLDYQAQRGRPPKRLPPVSNLPVIPKTFPPSI